MAGALSKLRMNSEGAIAVLKDVGVLTDLGERAERILAALPDENGEEWQINTFMGADRGQVVVRTGNQAARRAAAEDNALIKALDRGR